MRFLYVAPRFHPNQYPIIEGLVNKGHSVEFCVSNVGVTEKHDNIAVNVLSPSFFTRILKKIFGMKGKNYTEDKMIFFFSPSKSEVRRLLKRINPDVVILRERNLLSKAFFSVCKSLNIKKVILYNQSPIFEKPVKHNCKYYLKLAYRKLFPDTRMTVCRYMEYPEDGIEYIKDEKAHLLPFIARSSSGDASRSYTPGGLVRIFDCGKYRDYKNHYVLADAAKILRDSGFDNFHITIVGQANNAEEQEYYNNLDRYVKENGLADCFALNKSVPYDEMPNFYLNNDVFVLTSKRELANISILDSMSYGLATITTSANGTADYVSDGKNGYIFKTNDAEDLSEKLKIYLSDTSVVENHGRAGMDTAKKEYGFENYYKNFMALIKSLD